MNKIRTIATRVGIFMNNADLTNSPTLQQIHRDYCEGVMYINERLALCENLLQKGCVGEAVILADRTPSLFDLVPIIQAPNIIEFFDICQLYGLQSPPLINIYVYKSLEKSAQSAEVKESLLTELRKLARTQGSEDKVIILRKIVKLEPNEPEWKRQLKQAESTCVPTLIQQAQQAIIDKDFVHLDALQETLSSHEWELVIPDVVLNKIRRVLNDEEQRKLRISAKGVIDEIEKAYANRSLADYNRASSHWNMLCNIDYYVPSEEENHRVAVADSFFLEIKKAAAENEEYSSIIREFNGYLQSHTDVDYEDIEILYKRLASFGKEIPVTIKNFVDKQFALRERTLRYQGIKRGFRTFIFYVLSILILVTGCVCTWFAYNLKKLKEELPAAVSRNDFKKAEKLTNKIRKSPLPYTMFSSTLRKSIAEYEKNKEGLKKFDEVATKLEQALNEIPDESQKERIESLLADCRQKATMPKAKERLNDLESRYEKNFVAKIKEKQQKKIKDCLTRINAAYDKYTQALNKANYVQADEVYVAYLADAKELQEIPYFTAKDLTEKNKNLISPFFWLLAKHRSIYQAIESGIKANTFDSLNSMLELYKDNERALLNEGTTEQLKAAKVQDPAALKKRIELARNDKTVQDHIRNLSQLQARLTKALQKENTAEAEELLKEFKALFEIAKQVNPISQAQADSLKKLDLAKDWDKKLVEKKSFAAVEQTFKEHIAKSYDNNSKYALIDAIELAENSESLTKAQRDTIKTLKYQLDYLQKIYDFQNDISSAIWSNQSYEFFRIVADVRLFEQKDEECFENVFSSMEDLCDKYKDNEIIYFAFRDGKSRIKSYCIPADTLKKSLTTKKQDGVTVISFKTEKSLITIEGDIVTETEEIDGAARFTIFKNVSFIYPREITADTISKAISPHYLLVYSIVDDMNKFPKTIFSKEYYNLLLRLKKQKNCSPVHLLELCKLLLKPFQEMRNFDYEVSDKHYNPFNNNYTRKTLNDIYELEQYVVRLLDEARAYYGDSLNHADNKYNADIEHLNFTPVDKFIKICDTVHKFNKFVAGRTFNGIGVAKFSGRKILFTQGDGATFENGEVWIFAPDGSMKQAGVCKDGNITWQDLKFQNHISIVFMPNDKIDTIQKNKEFKESLSALGINTYNRESTTRKNNENRGRRRR